MYRPHAVERGLLTDLEVVAASLRRNGRKWRDEIPAYILVSLATVGSRAGVCEASLRTMFLGTIVMALVCGLAPTTVAYGRNNMIVILPPPRIVAPPEPRPQISVTVPYWTPLPAEGPRVRPPKPQCYANNRSCPLERSEMLGQACECLSDGRTVTGRALIPPSRHIGTKG